MKFKSRKPLAAMIFALSIANSIPSTRPIYGYTSTYASTQTDEKDNLQSDVPDEIKQNLISKLSEETIIIDSEFSDYISSIDLDGSTVNIELSNGELISSNIRLKQTGLSVIFSGIQKNNSNEESTSEEKPQTIVLKDLKLKKLYIQDTNATKKYLNQDSYDIVSEYANIFSEICSNFTTEVTLDNVKVSDELKFSAFSPYNLSSLNIIDKENWKWGLNYSKCKNIWFHNINIDNKDLKDFSKNPNLKSLILTRL